MNSSRFHPRRRLFLRALAGAGAVLVAGCDRLSKTEWFPKLLGNTEILTRKAQRMILPRKSMAQEFSESDRSPEFRSNGTAMPDNPQYKALASSGFAAYGLEVGGLVEKPVIFSLEELRALPSRTQTT
nr:molybdopterin-binding protein [Pseudomonadota bacterium]